MSSDILPDTDNTETSVNPTPEQPAVELIADATDNYLHSQHPAFDRFAEKVSLAEAKIPQNAPETYANALSAFVSLTNRLNNTENISVTQAVEFKRLAKQAATLTYGTTEAKDLRENCRDLYDELIQVDDDIGRISEDSAWGKIVSEMIDENR